jgi:hypothetical protein
VLHTLSLMATLVSVSTAALEAQAPSFQVSKLALGTDSVAISIQQDGKERSIGLAWDQLALVTGQPRRLSRVYRMENNLLGPLLDTVVFDLPSLRTWSRRTISKINSDSLFVVGDSVFGWQQVQDGARQAVALSLPRDVIDANAFDLVIRSTDWKPGLERTWSAFLPTSPTPVSLGAKLEGMEVVHQRNGTEVNCWRILGDFAGVAGHLLGGPGYPGAGQAIHQPHAWQRGDGLPALIAAAIWHGPTLSGSFRASCRAPQVMRGRSPGSWPLCPSSFLSRFNDRSHFIPCLDRRRRPLAARVRNQSKPTAAGRSDGAVALERPLGDYAGGGWRAISMRSLSALSRLRQVRRQPTPASSAAVPVPAPTRDRPCRLMAWTTARIRCSTP